MIQSKAYQRVDGIEQQDIPIKSGKWVEQLYHHKSQSHVLISKRK